MGSGERPRSAMRVVIRGRVQGVGFRPFVHRRASALGVTGTVQNRTGDVEIVAEGSAASLDALLRDLQGALPPLAVVDAIDVQRGLTARGLEGFHILPSRQDGAPPTFAPDTATCEGCLAELDDPRDRHHGYPFLSCTACGPRLTIVEGAPWDRARTTMASFTMCAACQAAYEDPADRRFHAQPIACPACGPTLRGETLAGFAARLREGAVGAIKGLGGFHLACDARSEASVDLLRRQKGRPHEPLAVMVADTDRAATLVWLDARERALLESGMRPIVLARRREGASLPEALAPGLAHLGVMLPYTALHVLLMREMAGAPLVMTSANHHGAPMLYRDADEPRLEALADVVLSHTRPIALRADDSVVRADRGSTTFVRLGRGATPARRPLGATLAVPTVALGGHLKAAFALGVGEDAVLAPHVGDLDDVESERSFRTLLDRMMTLHRFTPARVIVDLHPDYATRRIADTLSVPVVEVGHHHAHFAAVFAEHTLEGDALGVLFDGAGLGPDGSLWGGEILAGSPLGTTRIGHLRRVALAGGERAFHEPWRVAYAILLDAGLDPDAVFDARFAVPAARRRAIRTLLEGDAHTVHATSAGRWFDAAAFLTGLVETPTYEAHGPMWLEAAAWRAGASARDEDGYPFEVRADVAPFEIDPRAAFTALLRDVERERAIALIAADFHDGLAAATARGVVAAARARDLDRVLLGGGVMVNERFAGALARRLTDAGLEVFRAQAVPPNDGGLAFGQLAVVAARDGEERRGS